MSNVIKAYTVRYEDVVKKTIETHIKVEQDIISRRNLRITQEEITEEFVEGLNAIVIDPISLEENQKELAERLLEDAKTEAEQIIENARLEADKIKNEVYLSSKNQGYEDGVAQYSMEVDKIKQDYQQKNIQLQKQYDGMVKQLEPQMGELIASLIQKITGILVEDSKDVILYLVEKALQNADRTNNFTIRTSADDYELLLDKKNELLELFPNDVHLNIVKDPSFVKNQCVIDTDLRRIDCSLGVQLETLKKDLKLLCRI